MYALEFERRWLLPFSMEVDEVTDLDTACYAVRHALDLPCDPGELLSELSTKEGGDPSASLSVIPIKAWRAKFPNISFGAPGAPASATDLKDAT
jgi:hypothetical protein